MGPAICVLQRASRRLGAFAEAVGDLLENVSQRGACLRRKVSPHICSDGFDPGAALEVAADEDASLLVVEPVEGSVHERLPLLLGLSRSW